MRITLCVDALQPQLSGIGRYTWELCRGLRGREEISELRFYGDHELVREPERLLREGHRAHPHLRGPRKWLRSWELSRALQTNLVHGPNYFLPLSARSGVITVHDLSVFRYPDTHPAERIAAFERLFNASLARSVHVITDTETIRRELIDSFSLSPERVTAVPLGVDRSFKPREPHATAPTLHKWGLSPGRYGLSVAAFQPRKKISELVRAWRRLPLATRQRFPLALAGGSGWRNTQLHEEISSGVSEGWLRFLGFVDEADLPHLYSGARLFIYPSIYEGFGLPPVEAMASGVPILVADRSCLPEVCGDAARYVDPDDTDAFVAALEQCLIDNEWRSLATSRGGDRAATFTWDRCVSDTVAIYSKFQGNSP